MGRDRTVKGKTQSTRRIQRQCLRLLKAEQETIKNYRKRIRQAERSAEFPLSETLRDIIVQEQDHELDLKDARAYEIVIRSKSK